MDTLQTELNTHYPYLYGESNYPHTNHDRNPQSVPFPQGSFFGPTENQYHVSTENSRSTIEETYTTQSKCLGRKFKKYRPQKFRTILQLSKNTLMNHHLP